MRLNKKMKRKLKSNKGESLAEVLIGLLIIACGLVLLVSMIMSSSRLIERQDKLLGTVYTAENQMETGTAASAGQKTITIKYGNTPIKRVGNESIDNRDDNSQVNVYQVESGIKDKKLMTFDRTTN